MNTVTYLNASECVITVEFATISHIIEVLEFN